MSVLPIIMYPDKRLREKAAPIDADGRSSEFDTEMPLTRFLNDMEDTVEATSSGLALAATQVGIPYQLIVFRQHIDGRPLDGCPEPWVANPEMVSHSDTIEEMNEGCLSFPGFFRKKRRFVEMTVSYQVVNSSGEISERKTEIFKGKWAQVLAHEMEHLEGVLFVDDMPKTQRERLALEMTKVKRR